MTYLMQIRDSVQVIAEAIAAAVKVDVQIVDEELNRIAITGTVRGKVGEKVFRGNIFKKLIDEGIEIYLNSPSKSSICMSCPKLNECDYAAGIFYPIRLKNGSIAGAISLEAFNKEQQKNLDDSLEAMHEFLKRMADLIATKIYENITTRELKVTADILAEVVNNIDDGVIAVDGKGLISCCNSAAQKSLGIYEQDLVGQNIDRILPAEFRDVLLSGKPIKSEEMTFKMRNRTMHLVINAKPLQSDGTLSSAIMSFVEFSKAKKIAYDFTKKQKDIIFDDILGTSEQMVKLKMKSQKVANSVSTVLLTGESGTGKELFARAIHEFSIRSKEPFIAINCGAIPEQLLESELFGYEGGAFTGAKKSGKPGKFELADGGTIFLDEIGNMSLYMQAKLLRVLQEKVVERVGSTAEKPINVRVIAATNADLGAMTAQGEFRDDLFYRLNVIPLYIPPLRERRDDIIVLLEHFLHKFSNQLGKEINGFDSPVIETCLKYDWPGNVRELGNVVEYAVNVEEGSKIRLESTPKRIFKEEPGSDLPTLEDNERKLIYSALEKYGYSVEGKEKAAKTLGISRTTLYRKLKKYGST